MSGSPSKPAGFGEHDTTEGISRREHASVRRFRLTVVEGPDQGRQHASVADRCSLGSHASNDLVLSDPSVSRFHCEVLVDARGARVHDLGSRNGTILDGVVVLDAFLREQSLLRLGRSVLRFELGTERNQLPISERQAFGSLVGSSAAMRGTFALLERAAPSEATVLLEGETGTGKEGAAESIHRASERRDRPFVVIDCGAIPANLLESELFGHERGAFTGASERRVGAFEEAQGGTLFLDEIGELPIDLQPKLLRVLEQREVRRLGSNQVLAVDVRVVAATHRDLRAEINVGRFRSDLYFRLAVIRIGIPPLRDRPEDIPILVEHLLRSLEAAPSATEALRSPEFLHRLQSFAWPGNVRELRNYLERCLVLDEASLPQESLSPLEREAVDLVGSYAAARRRAIADFERRYVETLLKRHDGKVMEAARAAGINRVHLFRLTKRHGLKE